MPRRCVGYCLACRSLSVNEYKKLVPWGDRQGWTCRNPDQDEECGGKLILAPEEHQATLLSTFMIGGFEALKPAARDLWLKPAGLFPEDKEAWWKHFRS